MEMRKIALILFLTPFTTAQRVFIDGQPAYKQLPPCAEVPLSGIVRDMRSGCGDGQKTTSYNCFCTASSSKFSNIISTAVVSSCAAKNTVDPVSAASSALDVFNSYCHALDGSDTSSELPASSNAVTVTDPAGSKVDYTPVRTQSGPISSQTSNATSWKVEYPSILLFISLNLGIWLVGLG